MEKKSIPDGLTFSVQFENDLRGLMLLSSLRLGVVAAVAAAAVVVVAEVVVVVLVVVVPCIFVVQQDLLDKHRLAGS
jgi:hypothetical protein